MKKITSFLVSCLLSITFLSQSIYYLEMAQKSLNDYQNSISARTDIDLKKIQKELEKIKIQLKQIENRENSLID